MGGFAAQILKKSALVYDIRWRDESGTAFYAILETDKARHQAFLKRLDAGDTFDLNAYGTIHHLGFGEPDDTLKAALREKYSLYTDE